MLNLNYSFEDSIAAIATPLSPAALSVIRTSGKDSIELISAIFSRKEALLKAPGGTVLHGWISDGGKKIDEVVLCIYRAPKSFTGENTVEIICHGGIGVTLAVFRNVIKAGFREAEAGEFSFRAFINGKIDLTEAEAIKEIIASETQTAAELAAGRLSGGLFSQIEALKQELLAVIASADVEIEYPEDEPAGTPFSLETVQNIAAKLDDSADSWAAEKIFRQGANIVIAGRTNAGKSSLFNCLIKEERAIVSELHGTTRDWLETKANFNGIPVSLYDTAGLRFTADKIEAEGVRRSKEIMKTADLILYLIDGNAPPEKQDTAFLSEVRLPCIAVLTKTDVLPQAQTVREKKLKEVQACFKDKPVIRISAKTGEGLKELVGTAYGILTGCAAKKDANAAAPGTDRQRILLKEASSLLKHAAANANLPLDIILQELEDAVRKLGEITGEYCSDEILEKVFSGFCVGK